MVATISIIDGHKVDIYDTDTTVVGYCECGAYAQKATLYSVETTIHTTHFIQNHRKGIKMPNDDVTPEDIKATAEAKVNDVKDAASEKVDEAKSRLNNLSVNQKLVITGAAAVAISTVICRIVNRFRAIRVDDSVDVHIDEVVLVKPEDVQA